MTSNSLYCKTKKWKQQQLRIACWNVKSFKNKDQEIILEMEKHKLDICAISETRIKGKGTSRYQNYILAYSGRPKTEGASSGVGLIINDKYENNIEDINYINDRIIIAKLSFNDKLIHLISVYAPDASKPEQAAIEFYEQLQVQVDKIPSNERLILLGDLNARVGNDIVDGVKQVFNEEVSNTRGEMLIEFCAHNELRINNTFFKHKIQHKYTFTDNRGNKSMIDFIITNRNIQPKQILDVRCLTSANIGSDHNLILGKFRIAHNYRGKKSPIYVEKYNISSIEDPSTRQLYENRLNQHIINNEINEDDNVEHSWNKLKTNIYKTAEEALGKRKININAKPNTKPWFTIEVKEITEEKRKAFLESKSKKTPQAYQNYVRIRNQTNNRIREIKNQYWQKFSSDIERDMYGSQKRVWKLLRGLKKTTNEEVEVKAISEERWVQHFKQLYEDTNAKNDDENEVNNEQINEGIEITIDQIRSATKKLKNRKTPGEDQICNELIKYGGESLLQEINKLFNKILTTGKVPSEWKQSITIPLFKKGDKKDPANYRGITLLNSVMKLFTSIIATVLAQIIPMSEEQQGFRKNRSTIDAIFTLKQITEKAIEFNKPAFICFVDLTKAFDRILLKDVLKILADNNVPVVYRKLIKELNTKNTTKVRVDKKLSKEIETTTGIRQGDSLSPLLFNIIMDKIIEAVRKRRIGYRLGNHCINCICYADDAVLIAESEDDLQRLLYIFQVIAEKYNMKIAATKTKSMTISKEPLRCKLVVNNTNSIEQVMSFEYLGVKIYSNGNLKEEVKKQTNKAATISGHLRQVIWRNKHLSLESKTRIYKTCVRPVMTYGAEARADTAVTKRQLRTTEMKTLRSIAGYTMWDRKTNTFVREKCQVKDVVRWARARRREWNEHVTRMADNRIAKIARNERPHTTRPPGRPPRRWRDSWKSISQEQQSPA